MTKLSAEFVTKLSAEHGGVDFLIDNISSISMLVNAPRFSAYVASKAALDAWTRCASSEFADQGVTFTTVNMPLVRTPMTAPTKIYDNMPDRKSVV